MSHVARRFRHGKKSLQGITLMLIVHRGDIWDNLSTDKTSKRGEQEKQLHGNVFLEINNEIEESSIFIF
jgi:hypothetical protein